MNDHVDIIRAIFAFERRSASSAKAAVMQLQNYIAGQWVAGTGKQSELLDASTGELIATTSSGGPAYRQAGSTSPTCSTTPAPSADRPCAR